MNFSVEFFRRPQRLRARGRLQHGIAESLKIFPSHFAKRGGVLGQQNSFASLVDLSLGLRRYGWLNRLVDAREIYFKDGALIQFTVDPDVATALLYDAVNCRQAKAGALSEFFCCEKGIKDTRHGVVVHSTTCIFDTKSDVSPTDDYLMPNLIGFIQINVSRFNSQAAPVRHRIPGVNS